MEKDFYTNDFEKSLKVVVLKYARRWLVEKSISEQIDFFHLNMLGSAILVQVDFDLTMMLLAYSQSKMPHSGSSGVANFMSVR